MKRIWSIPALMTLCMVATACKKPEKQELPEPQKIRIQEGYSESFIQALEHQESSIEAATQGLSVSNAQAIRSVLRTWPNRRVITIAFKGGSADLRKQISLALKPWSDVANVTFDFGYDANTANYREWSTSDAQYPADVRISFDSKPEPGYWSAIGKDSIKGSLRPPSIASMNFEGFAEELPDDWRATVLHEFGHALGFAHEHQSTNSPCDQEYRWFDDSGYVPTQNVYHEFVPDSQGRKPGIYTVLGGAPNRWSKEKIEFNLKKFAPSSDWYLSSFDQRSIMKYVFQDWMYRDIGASTKSGCYTSPNVVLSAEDQKAAGIAYPRDPQEVKRLLNEQIQVSNQLLMRKHIAPELRVELNSITADLQKSKRQLQ